MYLNIYTEIMSQIIKNIIKSISNINQFAIVLLIVSNLVTKINGQGGNVGNGGNGGGGGGVNRDVPDYRDGGGGEIIETRSTGINPHEPSCEELRAMWRFSRRQSRAAEITNEIPTYRDPFAYNIWEPYYPSTRSVGGIRVSARYRDTTRPVFGRVLHKEPLMRLRDMPDRSRTFGDISRLYGSESKSYTQQQYDSQQTPRRRQQQMQFRFSGQSVGQNALTPQKGSFQRLKELVWTERARELAQQRKQEEIAARAAVLKEIANGHGYGPRRHDSNQQSLLRDGYELEVLPPSSTSSLTGGSMMSNSNVGSGANSGSGSSKVGMVEQLFPSKTGNTAEERMTAPVDKSMYPKYNDNAWIAPTNMLRRPTSLQRERLGGPSGRAKLRHGFPDMYYGGLQNLVDQQTDDYLSE